MRQASAFFLNRNGIDTISLGDSGKGVRCMTDLSDNATEGRATPEAASKLATYDLGEARVIQLL